MTSPGQCTKCNVTVNGFHESRCQICKPDNLNFCLKCLDYVNSRGSTGYYVTRDGQCFQCPAGSATCEDITGVPTRCRDGMGLVGGECRPCNNRMNFGTSCQICNGNISFCSQCTTPRPLLEDGYYPDGNTGICQPCDQGCRTCNGPGDCVECATGQLDPATKTCRCAIANCHQCTAEGECTRCKDRYGWDKSTNSCQPCQVANCVECLDGPAFCTACAPRYGLVLNECQRCATADSGCVKCDDNPAVCTECRTLDPLEHPSALYPDLNPDPDTGTCGPCRAPNCRRCSPEDATRCDASGYMILDGCFPGYAFNETSGQCLPCTATGCDSCSPDTPDKCDGCAVGYWWDEAAQVCAPCAAGCSVCARYKGQQCERCADGYYLERDTRLCKPATIADIDALLGIDVVAARAEAQAAAVAAPASGASAAEQAVPAEWAHLPAEELVRRQKLVRRRDMLGARQAELTAAIDLHERKAAYHSQQLRKLRGQKRALAEEQQSVVDAIDPEATAAARLAAAQARAAEEEAELQSRRQFAIGFWGVFVALCAARSHMDSVAADGWLDSPGPFSW
ncbi:hypothetical protein COHA_004977 [Chlorella ohadii]|uniref:Uncharacterized protein n=1 Tax=Chlorella ohadii TaxID=2649997 RepID=A0AAD5DS07_9CHLO|nr:hypothetical protein COHA_004977 [Chlorella ohadii]